MDERSSNVPTLPEVAFYYPGPSWHISDWIKNLILFFDGVALLVPEYIHDRPFEADPVLATALHDHNLLHILEPERLVDKAATEQLASALSDVITSGALDALDVNTAFHTLSMSRLGYWGDRELAQMIFEELKTRRLARETEDGLSIPMHPQVRTLVLVLLAQILRPRGASVGLDLSPATDIPDLVTSLTELLTVKSLPSSGSVVSFDLNVVGVDLGPFPVDEVLDFRRGHLQEHREYARSIKRFLRELSLVPEEERSEMFAARQAELDDLASDLKRASRRAWKQPSSFALTLAGAAWTALSGDPLSAILGLGGAALTLGGSGGPNAGAYSYLFQASRRFR